MRWRVRTAVQRDVWLGAALVGLLVLEWVAQRPFSAPWWAAAVWAVLLWANVAISGRRPLLALMLAGGLNLMVVITQLVAPSAFPFAYSVALFVLSYRAGRRMAQVRPALLAFGAVAAAALALALVFGLTGAAGLGLAETLLTWFSLLVVLLVAVVVPWLAGRVRHQQVALAQAGWERAEQLEREQWIVGERERLRERARIAQDMHDSLGHELSLMALRAGALELATDLDERHRRAVGELRSATAAATQRLHEIIGVLREDGAQPPLEPAGETVAELIDRARASGMALELTTTGAASAHGTSVDRTVYRVVQEALTNAAKHAAGAAVTVHLGYAAQESVVTVTNTAGVATSPGGGRGLAALTERVRLLGGTLSAGPRDGGFAVHARLPHDAPTGPELSEPVLSASAWLRELAQRQLRRRLAAAIGVPVALGAALAVVSLAYYAAITRYSVLEPAEFALLRVGAERALVEPLLPPMQMIDPPSLAGPPTPEGASCQYYRSSAEIFAVRFQAYRVCFDGDVLVAKDTILADATEYTG